MRWARMTRMFVPRPVSGQPAPSTSSRSTGRHRVVPISNQVLQRAAVALRSGSPDVSQPGDALEREAERMADRVTRSSDDVAPTRSGTTPPGAAGPATAGPGGALPHAVRAELATAGEPLDAGTRAIMERRFGRDLSQVRVHTGTMAARSAEDVRAEAYAVGSHLVFAPGRYAPRTTGGFHLLAHELAHVMQPSGLGAALRRFHLPHGADPRHQRDETAQIAPTYADMLATIKGIITASIAYGSTVNMDTFVLNAGGAPATKEIDEKLGTGSTPTVASMLSPRYLLTSRCGLLDMRHFIQLLYISQFIASAFPGTSGNEAATRRGRKHELSAESESRFGPEDTVSNALGAYTGSRLAGRPQADDLYDTIKDMLDRCDPVDFSGLSAPSKDTVRHFYGDLVSDPTPRRPGDLIPKNQNETAVPAIVTIPEFAGKERSFPFAIDVDDPDRKTISDTAFLKGSAGLTSDDDIRDFVATQRPEIIRDLPATEKVRLVRKLFEGWVADGDIDAIEVIYRNSSDADKQLIRSAIDVSDLFSIGQRARMRLLFGL